LTFSAFDEFQLALIKHVKYPRETTKKLLTI